MDEDADEELLEFDSNYLPRPRFGLGTRVRICRRTSLASFTWYEGVVVELWTTVGFFIGDGRDGRRGPRMLPYVIRLDENNAHVTVDADSDAHIQLLHSADQWKHLVFQEFCRLVASGQLSDVDFSGEFKTPSGTKREFDYLTDESAAQMGDTLRRSQGVVSVHIERSHLVNLGPEGVEFLARGIGGCAGLKKLAVQNFNRDNDDDDQVDQLDRFLEEAVLQGGSSLKTFVLSDCSLPSPGILEEILAASSLRTLHVHSCRRATRLQRAAVERGLRRNEFLSTASFTFCGSQLVRSCLKALSEQDSVQNVTVSHMDTMTPGDFRLQVLQGEVVPVLFDVAEQDDFRETLEEFIEAQGRRAAPVALTWAQEVITTPIPAVVSLDLLVSLVCRYDVLEHLDLSAFVIDSAAGASQIRRLLESASKLQTLQMPRGGSCLWGDAVYMEIAAGLRKNSTLEVLNVFISDATMARIDLIVSALSDHETLRQLTLGSSLDVGLLPESSRMLSKGLLRLRGVKKLDVAGCLEGELTEESFEAFWGNIQFNLRLEEIIWGDTVPVRMPRQVDLFLGINRWLNQYADRLLKDPESAVQPKGLWCHVLARVAPKTGALFYLVRGYPSLIENVGKGKRTLSTHVRNLENAPLKIPRS